MLVIAAKGISTIESYLSFPMKATFSIKGT